MRTPVLLRRCYPTPAVGPGRCRAGHGSLVIHCLYKRAFIFLARPDDISEPEIKNPGGSSGAWTPTPGEAIHRSITSQVGSEEFSAGTDADTAGTEPASGCTGQPRVCMYPSIDYSKRWDASPRWRAIQVVKRLRVYVATAIASDLECRSLEECLLKVQE